MRRWRYDVILLRNESKLKPRDEEDIWCDLSLKKPDCFESQSGSTLSHENQALFNRNSIVGNKEVKMLMQISG